MEKESLLPYVSPRRPQPSPPQPLSLCPLPEDNEITIPPLIPICEFHLLQNQRSDPKKPDPKKTSTRSEKTSHRQHPSSPSSPPTPPASPPAGTRSLSPVPQWAYLLSSFPTSGSKLHLQDYCHCRRHRAI
ncbi:Uncharacterized protein Fot_10394 [Forsythia ovata]|uniref:Uncharacterized protein n=1 Tax=Forsythia ovata TaxID=205694 RepID=A0ABD1WGP6_9LAMI